MPSQSPRAMMNGDEKPAEPAERVVDRLARVEQIMATQGKQILSTDQNVKKLQRVLTDHWDAQGLHGGSRAASPSAVAEPPE